MAVAVAEALAATMARAVRLFSLSGENHNVPRIVRARALRWQA